MQAGNVDPFTFEIIRHKLFRVTEEAVVALESVSGTPISAEAHDLMVSLYRDDGALMVGGTGFLQHLTSASQAVKHIIASFAEDPGIFEDDVFLLNDSYTAALHAPDVYLIAPIHWNGKLAGFVADFVHVNDIGGIDPGGFCPSARSSYHEGFSSRGLKLVERGKLRKDVFETILNMVRDPGLVGLDIKSLLAANHVAKQRMLKLYADYGYETVDVVSRELIAQSDRLMRQRLMEIPDGTWRARQYYEHPERIMRIELVATKYRDTLTFDFSGAPPQVTSGVNCSYWATWGSIFGSLFPMLAYDMVWNDGIFNCIKLIAPEGTVVNARRPAPVSLATIGVVQIVRNLVLIVISKMLGASEIHHRRATGLWQPTNMIYHLSGTTIDGEHLGHHGTDTFSGTGGARSFKDGVDNGGMLHAPVARCANVERHEMSFPHRYLYRRIVADSGGPGKYRGGVCHEYAVVPHRTGENKFSAVLMPGRGAEALNSQGLFGGYPGCNTAFIQFRGAREIEHAHDLASTHAERQEKIGLGVTEIHDGDIQYIRYDGAAGYGDPLDRDPELVLHDVLWGIVTGEPARDIYGVVVDVQNKSVDVDATRARRAFLRSERLGGGTLRCDPCTRTDIARTHYRIGEYLQVSDAGLIQCTWCGDNLCKADADWKEHAVMRKSAPSRAGPLRVDSGRFFLLEFFCPGCGTTLDVDIAYLDDPPLIDRISHWPESAAGGNIGKARETAPQTMK
jgi:N-methylhydantoinase B